MEWINGKTFRKTFFPKNWTRKKVALKIKEALKNAIIDPNSQPNRLQATGTTIEGIVIRFNVENIDGVIKVTSAFPCEKWMLGLIGIIG